MANGRRSDVRDGGRAALYTLKRFAQIDGWNSPKMPCPDSVSAWLIEAA
jgi:hypothetical protein